MRKTLLLLVFVAALVVVAGGVALAATRQCDGPANCRGTEMADRMFGDDGGNLIHSLGGQDTLHGRDGTDTIEGGPGMDERATTSSATGPTASPTTTPGTS